MTVNGGNREGDLEFLGVPICYNGSVQNSNCTGKRTYTGHRIRGRVSLIIDIKPASAVNTLGRVILLELDTGNLALPFRATPPVHIPSSI